MTAKGRNPTVVVNEKLSIKRIKIASGRAGARAELFPARSGRCDVGRGAGGGAAERSVCRRAPPPPWATNIPPHTPLSNPGKTCTGNPQVMAYSEPSAILTSAAPRMPTAYESPPRPQSLCLFLKRLCAAIPKAWHNKTNRKTIQVHVMIISHLIL